ncbi:MAG: hypothetical protein U0V74_08485 [Chitinophagales bacterium]
MRTVTKTISVTVLAAWLVFSACSSTKHHWHRTTKAERDAKKNHQEK